MDEPLFLGFDAGGSKTVCLAGDRTSVLARGEGGPANPNVAGLDGFRSALDDSARGALETVGRRGAAAAWIGIAGSEGPGVREALRRAALEVLDVEEVWVSHDARLLLAAASVSAGIAVVAGTGSSVYGRAAGGREVTVGGWGHLLGDEGSGYDIGRRALRAVTQAADGRGARTRLTDAIQAALGAADVWELRERCYPTAPVPELARLARIVLDLASSDEVSASIVARAAADLALAVNTCRERLELPPSSPVRVVAAGGLLGRGSPLLRSLTSQLQGKDARYGVAPLTAEPATGALALARDGPGRTRDPVDEPPTP